MSNEYRCYHFGNFYLSSIQQGIQSAHAQTNMFLAYPRGSGTKSDILYEWARSPTMVCLNGGAAGNLLELQHLLELHNDKYPHATFFEEETALQGCITNVGIILPKHIYSLSSTIKKSDVVFNNGKVIVSPPSADPIKYATNVILEEWEYNFVVKYLSTARLAT